MAGKARKVAAKPSPLTKEGAQTIRDLQKTVNRIETELKDLQGRAQELAAKRNAALTEIKRIFESAVDSAIAGT